MKTLKFILCLLFGLVFINAGMDKLLHYMPVPEMSPEMIKIGTAFMTIKWLLPLVSSIEILGGLLFILPKTRALGAIVILPVLVGINIHNITFMPSGLVVALPLLLIELWILIDNKHKYKLLIS